MIPLQEQERLKQYFAERLTGGVKIEHFTQRPLSILVAGREECRFCAETRQTLEELHALSPKLRLQIHELSESAKLAAGLGVDRVPATVFRGQLNRSLRIDGFPGAGLFPPFVDALVSASRGATELDARLKHALRRIQARLDVRVYVSPAGPYCPPMTSLAYAFGLENQRLRVSVIEVDEFPRLAESLRIRAVPTTVLGDRARIVGAIAPDVFIEQLAHAAEGQALTVGESLLGTSAGPSTPLGAAPEPRTSASGLILPGR
jgi:alkyl hydroperoxide reductase subunit AhpF